MKKFFLHIFVRCDVIDEKSTSPLVPRFSSNSRGVFM